MQPVKSFVVKASLPKNLEALREIAYNMWWYWNSQSVKLFYRLDRSLWEDKYHNPVSILGSITQERLNKLSHEESILAELERVKKDFDNYINGATWFSKNYPDSKEYKIAYFSLEFGLAESVPIYSGGLGILAGDHLKSASDLGIPLVGVGLLYQEGYFRQYLNNDGWQNEEYSDNDFFNMPVMPVLDKNNKEMIIEIDLPAGTLKSKIWKIKVGRVPLFLLDTNIPENPKEYRRLTASLYGGDSEMRLQQEMLLGIGGLRALYAMDIWPLVCHMNEGHAAFLALERMRTLMESDGLTYDESFELASAGNVFTTHTPVEAGHDRFSPEMMLKYFKNYYPELGLTAEEFLGLGRLNTTNATEAFCMTVLALKTADKSNAVSRLHKYVSREMWQGLWTGFPVSEIPIHHITNGVHISSWVSHDMVDLFDRYLGPRWRNEPASKEIWGRVKDIPDEEIWRTHERRRERLVTFARKRLARQLKKRGVSESELRIASGILNSKALTIGFARRFATYKRAGLIFSDIERIKKILKNPEKPVQIIIAGKAHPKDNAGKDLIRDIIHFTRDPEIRSHVVFIEDYDINVARYLVQGVDVWLNTPRRPLEASGTSGMKATANGAINFSVLDGWWDEAYTPETGWAIGSGETYENQDYQDEVESNAIYDILEKDLVPLFYDIGPDGMPRKWVEKMKTAMSEHIPVFNTDRMVHQYFREFYQPGIERYMTLSDNKADRAKNLSMWKKKIIKNWNSLRILKTEMSDSQPYSVGGTVTVRANIALGSLSPEDILVEIYSGGVDADNNLVNACPIPMNCTNQTLKHFTYEGAMPLDKSGRLGFSVRVTPAHPDMACFQDLMLVKWA